MRVKEFEFQATCNPPCNKFTVVTIIAEPETGPRFTILVCSWCGKPLPQSELDKAIDQYSKSIYAKS